MSASITIEAAIVIPLYIYAVLSIMYMLKVIDIKKDIETALYNAVRSMSKYAYATEGLEAADYADTVIGDAYLYGSIIDELGNDYCIRNNIVGGNAGVIVLGSSIMESDSKIKCCVNYTIKNPFDIFGIALVKVNQSVETEAWLGEKRSGEWKNTSDSEDEEYVYITPTGSVYHINRSCTTLKLSVKAAGIKEVEKLRNKSGGKYYCCERCKGEKNAITVYITDYGERYHYDSSCSGLKRTIIEIPKSRVSDKRMCEKCGNS